MEKFEQLLENALDAVVGIDHREQIVYWNKQASLIFGFSKSEAIGQNMGDLIVPPKYREAHRRGMSHFLRTEEGPILNHRIEITALRKDQKEFPVELTVSPMRKDGEFFFYSFIRDITQQKEDEADRMRLLKDAQDAVRIRDDFIGICSHELKTPLTSLSMQFQIAESQLERNDLRALSKESVSKRVKSALAQSRKLIRLIDDMTDISRISSGRLHIHKAPFELNSLITELVDKFSGRAAALESFIAWSPGPEIQIVADRDRIEQVFTNLLTNALKYSPGTLVNVKARILSEGAVQISVKDHGKGIAEENLQRIFEKFERGANSAEVSGLGIGLYISRQIVEDHGGTIHAESKIGQGSNFIVRLPLA